MSDGDTLQAPPFPNPSAPPARRKAERIAIQLEDFDGPWPTTNRPTHILDEPA